MCNFTFMSCRVSELIPNEIQESISSLNWFNVPTVGNRTVPAAFPGSYDYYDDDADEHGDQGGHHVVDNCTHSHFTRSFAIQGGNTCDRGNQIQNICLRQVQILLLFYCYNQPVNNEVLWFAWLQWVLYAVIGPADSFKLCSCGNIPSHFTFFVSDR